MMVRVKIRHHTEYSYDREVVLSPHLIRMRPAPHCRMPVHKYSMTVRPADHFLYWQQDPLGNYVARCVFRNSTRLLAIDVEIIADVIDINPFDFFVEENVVSYPFQYDPELAVDLSPYLQISENDDLLRSWIAGHSDGKENTINFLVTLNRRMHAEIKYQVREEPGIQTCSETLGRRSGSCRDSAWLLIQTLRHLGMAARYVSGYLVHRDADPETAGELSPGKENRADLHAWVEVYLPGAGWLGLDPSAGLFAGRGYIPLACTARPASAAPVTGTHSAARTEFSFSSSVKQLPLA